jgi:mannose-6-phosphate isomerase-like protein (cupin superfamily)
MRPPLPAYALDRDGGERLVFGGVTVLVRASAEATGGAFTLFEEVAPLADTPAHVHENEDELFYALEGEHIIRVGDDELHLRPGGLAFAPRGVPHAQRRVVPHVGRMLILTSPAGLEGFFRELAQADREGTLGPAAYAKASERYGISWLD